MTNPTPLPALPEPGVNIPAGDWTNITDSRYYTDTQMRTYAESAIAALGSSMTSGEALTDTIAGAVFDFLGFLTSHDTRWKFSSYDDATPAVKAIEEWAAKRGLALDEANVKGWTAALATQPTASVQGGLTDERKEFEADYLRRFSKPGYLGRGQDGEYGHFVTRARWGGWRARAALSANAGSQQSEPVAWQQRIYYDEDGEDAPGWGNWHACQEPTAGAHAKAVFTGREYRPLFAATPKEASQPPTELTQGAAQAGAPVTWLMRDRAGVLRFGEQGAPGHFPVYEAAQAGVQAAAGAVPTNEQLRDAADDFKSQYKHGGTTFDEFDYMGYARAVLALAAPADGKGAAS